MGFYYYLPEINSALYIYLSAFPGQKDLTFANLYLIVCISSHSPVFPSWRGGILKRHKLISQFFSSPESLLWWKLPDFNLLLGLAIWLALDLPLKFSDATHAHKAAELWNHPQKRFTERKFSYCSISRQKHIDNKVVCLSTLHLLVQQWKTR